MGYMWWDTSLYCSFKCIWAPGTKGERSDKVIMTGKDERSGARNTIQYQKCNNGSQGWEIECNTKNYDRERRSMHTRYWKAAENYLKSFKLVDRLCCYASVTGCVMYSTVDQRKYKLRQIWTFENFFSFFARETSPGACFHCLPQ